MFFNKKAGIVSDIQNDNQIDFICVSDYYAVFASHDSQEIRILKYEDNKQKNELSYDPSVKHDEARISADQKTLMLFDYKSFTLIDVDGNIIKKVEIPNADFVYDQQYRRKGGKSYLEVTYNDGTVNCFDASTGEQIESGKTYKIDSSLDEVFFTDKYRIDSPLHGIPKVYDKQSGKMIAELQVDSYLTYVTQVGDLMVVQYRDTNGYFYGQLLNEKCEVVADLPYLCDVYNGEVFFDYPEGVVRKSAVYNLNELLILAKKNKTEV